MFNKQTLRVMINERLSETAEEILSLFEQAVAEYQREIDRLKNASKAKPMETVPTSPQLSLEPAQQAVMENEELPGAVLKKDDAGLFHCKEEIEQVMITQEDYKPQMLMTDMKNINKEDDGLKANSEESEEHLDGGAEIDNSFKLTTESEEEESDNEHNFGSNAPKKSFSCPHCNKLFPHKRGFKLHMRMVHNEDEPLTSSEYNIQLDSEQHSALQPDTESPEARPWSCTFCFRRFKQMEGLGMHMREHDGERLFRCTECGAAFAKQANFSCHMKTMHSTDKPFKCSVCDKCLKTAHALRTHMLIHTGERPFKCSVCGRGFVQKVSLKNHMVTHTGEKPFTCTECGKNYSTKQSLMIHMRLTHH